MNSLFTASVVAGQSTGLKRWSIRKSLISQNGKLVCLLMLLLLAACTSGYAQGYTDGALLASNVTVLHATEVEAEAEVESPRAVPATTSARGPMMTIQGRVIDVDKDPLVGATILVEGTHLMAITDADGCYKLTIPAGRYTLRCGSAGYYDDEVLARPTATNQTVVLKYRPDAFKRIKR